MRDAEGAVIACVSVAGMARRLGDASTQDAVLAAVLEAAEAMSEALAVIAE